MVSAQEGPPQFLFGSPDGEMQKRGEFGGGSPHSLLLASVTERHAVLVEQANLAVTLRLVIGDHPPMGRHQQRPLIAGEGNRIEFGQEPAQFGAGGLSPPAREGEPTAVTLRG
jgi:hypothetical protein